MNSATHEPVTRSLIVLAGADGQQSTFSGAQGLFSFRDLPSGTYFVNVTKPGFRAARAALPPYAGIEVGPSHSDLIVSLDPYAAIQGTVVDQDDDPISDVQLEVMSVSVVQGVKRIITLQGVHSDSAGTFRFWNLEAGQYYVHASGRTPVTNAYVGRLPASRPDISFQPAYLGGASNVQGATLLELKAGETAEAEFHLTAAPVYSVSGTIAELNATAPPSFRLLAESGESFPVRLDLNLQTGAFRIRDVPRGSYLLQADQLENDTLLRAEAPVQVGDQDLTGAALHPTAAVSIPVTVIGPASAPKTDSLFALATPCPVILSSTNTFSSDTYFPALVDGAGLVIRGVPPGTYTVHASCTTGYAVSLQSGSEDLLTTGKITVGEQSGAPKLELVVSPDAGSLHGKVIPFQAQSPLQILLCPTDPGRDTAVLLVSDDGHFDATSLAPGAYTVYAVTNASNLEYGNPDVLAKLSGGKQIEIRANTSSEITLEGPER